MLCLYWRFKLRKILYLLLMTSWKLLYFTNNEIFACFQMRMLYVEVLCEQKDFDLRTVRNRHMTKDDWKLLIHWTTVWMGQWPQDTVLKGKDFCVLPDITTKTRQNSLMLIKNYVSDWIRYFYHSWKIF